MVPPNPKLLDMKEEKFRRIVKIFGHVSLDIVILELEKPFRSFKIETFSTKKRQQIFDWERGEQEETLKKSQLCFSLFELMDMSISIWQFYSVVPPRP